MAETDETLLEIPSVPEPPPDAFNALRQEVADLKVRLEKVEQYYNEGRYDDALLLIMLIGNNN